MYYGYYGGGLLGTLLIVALVVVLSVLCIGGAVWLHTVLRLQRWSMLVIQRAAKAACKKGDEAWFRAWCP